MKEYKKPSVLRTPGSQGLIPAAVAAISGLAAAATQTGLALSAAAAAVGVAAGLMKDNDIQTESFPSLNPVVD